MKTLTKTITAYTFSELNESAKEKAKQWYLENFKEAYHFREDIENDLKDTYGLKNLKFLYSLSYSQGDGFCMYGKITDYEAFKNPKFSPIALNGLNDEQINSLKECFYKVDLEHRHHRHYFAETTFIEIDELTYDTTEEQIELLKITTQNIKKWYLDYCKEAEKCGYYYFHEATEEEIDDTSQANEYMFLEDGSYINLNEYSEVA